MIAVRSAQSEIAPEGCGCDSLAVLVLLTGIPPVLLSGLWHTDLACLWLPPGTLAQGAVFYRPWYILFQMNPNCPESMHDIKQMWLQPSIRVMLRELYLGQCGFWNERKSKYPSPRGKVSSFHWWLTFKVLFFWWGIKTFCFYRISSVIASDLQTNRVDEVCSIIFSPHCICWLDQIELLIHSENEIGLHFLMVECTVLLLSNSFGSSEVNITFVWWNFVLSDESSLFFIAC